MCGIVMGLGFGRALLFSPPKRDFFIPAVTKQGHWIRDPMPLPYCPVAAVVGNQSAAAAG